jgi:hypothetical protein
MLIPSSSSSAPKTAPIRTPRLSLIRGTDLTG